MVEFAAYVLLLSLLTGLGLFWVAGVRGAAPWTVFALATLVAMLALAGLVRSALSAVDQVPRPEADPGLIAEASSGRVSLQASSQASRAEPADVDYLMGLRHEFRTPLNAVLGFSDVLLSGIDGEINGSQREDLEIVRASGIRLRILLDSALDLSELAEGRLRLNTERVEVRDLLGRATVEAGQLWSNKRAARCTLPEEPVVIEADEARLRRSILVLADFLAAEHRNAEIALALVTSDEHLAIDVTAEPSNGAPLDALLTPAEVLASEDPAKIRRWPVAVTSEIIAGHAGSLYHGSGPSRFVIRLPRQGAP
jgi:light-regulated signal transduction histidine kinase (bacteriophytochrome)